MQLNLNGVQLSYEDTAQAGMPLVFIHGYPLSKSAWESQWIEFKGSRRLIRWDLRGHGQTIASHPSFTLEFCVDDLFGLLDHLKIPKAILCGLSMGGYVALRAFERMPDRIAGLILADTKSEADTNEIKIKRSASIKTLIFEPFQSFPESILKSFLSAKSGKNDSIRKSLTDIISVNNPEGLCSALLALAARTDTTSILSKIQVPTLILVGEADTVTPPDTVRGLHNNIKGSEFHAIPEAGHFSNVESPEIFNSHLKSFLERHFS